MSRRIFVNIQNSIYAAVTQNRKGGQFGLGVPTQLSSEEQTALGQRGNEIYFTTDELLVKKRKIQVIFDSFTDPKFFGDGSVDINKVKKYVDELELEGQRQRQALSSQIAGAAAVGVQLGAAGVVGAGALASGVAYSGVSTGLTALGTTFGAIGALPLAAAIAALTPVFRLAKSNIQAAREDRKAPWKMTLADFPLLTGQARQDGNSKRSIERLYDNRQLFGGKNRSTKYAIARLTREALADALFSQVPIGGTTSVAVSQHPLNDDPEALAQSRHFPFRDVFEGPDQTARTYVNAVLYLKSYIDLIDAIINLQDESLSRSPDKDETQKILQLDIKLTTVEVPLFDAMRNAAQQVIREKVLTFFDETREYKTVLNFGDDKQYLAEAWRLAPQNTSSLQLKLTRPLESDIDINQSAYVVREFAQSVVDIIEFEPTPIPNTTPYLRPFNMDSKNYVDTKMRSTDVTLTTLGLDTGSIGVIDGTTISYGDTVFRRWFTGDFKSSELNIDFTDYNNFVHFGSAYKRLESFAQKLVKIEELTSASNVANLTSTVSARLKAKEKEEIIRNFDPYERFLYYVTESVAYSASAFYAVSETEYNLTGSWPKQTDGTPYSPFSNIVTNWFEVQGGIAQRFDLNNPNYLVKHLPIHIQEDTNSSNFLTFLSMVGHFVDNIKVYIDQFPYIYSTNPNPFEELSMDQVYEVAQSFGLQLPNVYALENLQSFNAQFDGDTGSRAYVAETWKRFLHSMVYFAKTKGSRTSLNALLSTYGINSPVLQIKETSYPTVGNYIQSDELTYGLQFTGSVNSYVTVPFVSSSISASTLQVTFNPSVIQTSSLLTGNGWAIDLIPHPSSSSTKYLTTSFDEIVREITMVGTDKTGYGKIHVVSGSNRTVIASSSYFPLFTTDRTNLMLRSQSADMTIIQTDGDQILFQESASVNLSGLWNTTQFVYLGGSGSLKLSSDFDGVVDEVRIWGENISDADFVQQSYDPGSYYGATYTSSYDNLYVHLPFSQPLASITSSATNESPYQNVSIVQNLPTVGFTTASYARILRGIKQFTPIVGSSVYTNNNINVIVPPQPNAQFIDEDGTYALSRVNSIKPIKEKLYDSAQNVVSFAISPTDYVNQNIMRSMGTVDVNNLIGSPRYITGSGYSNLKEIEKDYVEYFNKTVNPNEYIRFFKDLVEGPSELAESMVPARTKLLNGIVIESNVLSRKKDTLVRKFAVDGSGTKRFNSFISGSGSIGVGAYDFDIQTQQVSVLPTTLGDTTQITAIVYFPTDGVAKSSTKSNKLPSFRQVTQKVGQQFVTSSILDEQSGFVVLDTDPINGRIRGDVTSSGYPRTPFVGIPASASIPLRLESENNTLIPFYNIPPRANFLDVGSYTYFHKNNGIYSYDIYTSQKQPYLVKLDTNVDSPIDRVYAPVTLLPTGSLLAQEYGRNTTTIAADTYAPAPAVYYGTIKVANIFTLYGITGQAGLRIRFYRNETDRLADTTRSFNTIPAVNSGVLFDAILNGEQDVFPYLLVQTTDAVIYYTIENQTTSTIVGTSIILEYFAYEPDNLIPIGYLPRHYRFSRDNTTPIKRRNYLGCRSVNRTIFGEPPFTVRISKKNTITVDSTQASAAAGTGTVQIPSNSTTIQLGGAGKLRVE